MAFYEIDDWFARLRQLPDPPGFHEEYQRDLKSLWKILGITFPTVKNSEIISTLVNHRVDGPDYIAIEKFLRRNVFANPKLAHPLEIPGLLEEIRLVAIFDLVLLSFEMQHFKRRELVQQIAMIAQLYPYLHLDIYKTLVKISKGE